MLTWLADFAAYVNVLNVLRYITFRTGMATATAFLFVIWFGPAIIRHPAPEGRGMVSRSAMTGRNRIF